MSFSVTLKSYGASALHAMGYTTSRLSGVPSNSFTLLMYHRILPRTRMNGSIQAGMVVMPETFELHIRFLLKHFNIVAFKELLQDNPRSSAPPTGKPLCALTFDDGWADFYEFAFPILQTHEIPALVFLPTNYIGTMEWFWTDCLGYLFHQSNALRTSAKIADQSHARSIIHQLERMAADIRGGLESAIGLLKMFRDEQIKEILHELSDRWSLCAQPPGRAFLSWEEVGEMARSGLISYGSHTAAHRILTTLTTQEIEEELCTSKEQLLSRGAVEDSMIPFSYPNGDYNEQIARMVRDAGYNSAVITRQGWNRPSSDPFALLRVGLHQDMASSEAMLACRLLNIV